MQNKRLLAPSTPQPSPLTKVCLLAYDDVGAAAFLGLTDDWTSSRPLPGAVDGALAAASWQVLGGVVAVSLVLVVIAMQLWRTHAVLSAAEIKQFKADKEFVLDKVIKKKTDLYKRYLGEAVGPLHV